MSEQPSPHTSIAEAIAAAEGTEWTPVTYDNCGHVHGPFFHGTRADLRVGDELVPGHGSNYHQGRVANHVYFSSLLEPAVWAAELATGAGRERVYVVEPSGPFEDDPNVTDKKFPGNVTRSYRTRHAVRIVGEVTDWTPHAPDVLQAMRDSLADLRARGLDVIDD